MFRFSDTQWHYGAIVCFIWTRCAAFDELRNIWSTVQRTCNRVRVKVKIRVCTSYSSRCLVLELGLGGFIWKVHHIVFLYSMLTMFDSLLDVVMLHINIKTNHNP